MQRWVVWKYKWDEGMEKWTKVPYSPQTHQLFHRKAEECSTLELAHRVLMNHKFSGVGVSAVLQDGLTYLDFDKCLENGKIRGAELEKFILDLGSYTEVSPSGLGLRVIVETPKDLGRVNENKKRTDKNTPRVCEVFECEGVEAWNDGKYATLTGNLFRPDLAEIKRNDEVMARLFQLFDKKTAPTNPAPAPARNLEKPSRVWTRDEIRSALKHLDPSMPRNPWIYVGKALWDWNHAEGLSLWEEWSRGGSNFVEGECSKVWHGEAFANYPISVGHIIKEAKNAGWLPPQNPKNNPFKTKAETPSELPDNFPASDSGNAERLATTHEGKRMRYFVDAGRWYVFNGKRWVEDAEGVHCQRHARTTIRFALQNFKKKFPDPKSKERIEAEQFCLRSESAHALRATVAVARTLPEFQIENPDQLDADPHLLNTPGGVVNLKTCAKESHRPELMMTKMTKIAPDFEADCPMWEETVKNATMGDAQLREALEITLGMGVTGYTHEVFAIFFGASADNLKSTICETVGDLLGDYASSMPSKSLQAVRGSGGESATPSIAGLKGKRLVLADEWPESAKLDEAVLKRICSQDAITARNLHSNPITFTPSHLLILRTNHLPVVSAGDEGAWKRILPFPFKYKVPEDKKDEGFRRRMMKQEGGAILAWLCRCAMRFIELHERGGKLPRPQAVEELKQKYRAESDILAQWAEAEVEFGSFPPYFVSNEELKKSFESFAEEHGEEPKATSHRNFAMFLGKHGCNPLRKREKRGWTGLRLRIPDNPNEGGDGVEQGAF
jgi:P4 family phage/plasmid primase-like protien